MKIKRFWGTVNGFVCTLTAQRLVGAFFEYL